MSKKRLKLIRGGSLDAAPIALQNLVRMALHSIDASQSSPAERFDQAEGLIRLCIDLVGGPRTRADAVTWMLAITMKIHEDRVALDAAWPSFAFEYKGKIETRTLPERVFAAFALWRLEMALHCLEREEFLEAIEEVSVAGSAMHFSGTFGASELAGMSDSLTRRRAALVRWAGDPTQKIKADIQHEWHLWQANRSKFKYPRDFRRDISNRYPQVVDGTLKNWMSAWGKRNRNGTS